MTLLKSLKASFVTFTALFLSVQAPSPALAAKLGAKNTVVIYFTRHAEKQNELKELDNGNFTEICGEKKCAQELNAAGKLRAKLLVNWFKKCGITPHLTHAFSSHKQRTLQTIEKIAASAGLSNDTDLIADGVQQIPADGTELGPESTKPSRKPTIAALNALPGGSVAVVAGHSGTLYHLMEGLGLDTANEQNYPRDAKGKVRDFGDIWKVVIEKGKTTLAYRKNLQPTGLAAVD